MENFGKDCREYYCYWCIFCNW